MGCVRRDEDVATDVDTGAGALLERDDGQPVEEVVEHLLALCGRLLGDTVADLGRWSEHAAVIANLSKATKAAKPVIDYAGILFVGLAASGLTLATSWGGSEYAWTSPMIIGLFVASFVALAIFVWVEARTAEPILPIRLFASPVFRVCCILGFIVGFAMLGALTFLPTFMQFVDGVSATESGLRTLPMVAGMLITSIGSGNLVGRTGRYKVFPVAGTAIMAVAFGLLSQMTAMPVCVRPGLAATNASSISSGVTVRSPQACSVFLVSISICAPCSIFRLTMRRIIPCAGAATVMTWSR